MADLGKTEGLLVIKGDNDNGGGLACAIGIESTVCSVSLDGRKVTVLRCGAIGTALRLVPSFGASLLKGSFSPPC